MMYKLFVTAMLAGCAGAQAASFVPTGRFVESREEGLTLTVLPNGKVLAAGGWTQDHGGMCLRAADLYDPATGLWTRTGHMAVSRAYHTATLLHNGKVLVAGGTAPTFPVAGAEIYDPATGTWSPTGNLVLPVAYHSAVLLENGKVLVVGGEGAHAGFAELYDPAAGTWSLTGPPLVARWSAPAVLLPSGRVLRTGGGSEVAEIYDPASGTWSATGSMSTARADCTLVRLPDGKVLAAGGTAGGSYLSTAEIYDPSTGTWTGTAALPGPRAWYAATLLPDGWPFLAGGRRETGTLNDAVVFDPATQTWAIVAATMIRPRRRHAAVLLPDGRVLLAGGYGLDRDPAELFIPDLSISDLVPPAPAPYGALRPYVSNGLGNRDRNVVFDALATFTIQAAGVRIDPLFRGARAISAGIWEITPGGGYLNLGTRPAAPLLTATAAITDNGMGFYDVPISFTFQAGHRYSVGFNQVLPAPGWGLNTNMEFYHYGLAQAHDPPNRDNRPFTIGGTVKVLNGGYGGDMSQYNLPHIRLVTAP